MHIPTRSVQTCEPGRSCNLEFFLFALLGSEQGAMWLWLAAWVHLGPMKPGFSACAPCAKHRRSRLPFCIWKRHLFWCCYLFFTHWIQAVCSDMTTGREAETVNQADLLGAARGGSCCCKCAWGLMALPMMMALPTR